MRHNAQPEAKSILLRCDAFLHYVGKSGTNLQNKFDMKIIDILILNKSILNVLLNVGIKTSDVKYIDLYHDYLAMKQRDEKKTYIVAVLSEMYNISVRRVYSVLKFLEKDFEFPKVLK